MEKYCNECKKLKLLSDCFVKPSDVANEASKERYYLRAIDLLTLNGNPMQKGLLFDNKPQNVKSSFLVRFKKALDISLVHFYPLVGQFKTEKYIDEHACCIYVDCDKGPGARLIHASVDLTVTDIMSFVDVHPIVKSFFDLGEKSINYDGHTRPLLSVQVTELVDGVFIGFTMNHCIADGTSLWHFISTLSEIHSRINVSDGNENAYNDIISISRKPIFKTVGPDNRYGPITKLPYLEPDEFVFRIDPGPMRVRIFHFSSKSISMIKAKANEECGLANTISSFQALCGFVWRSITRARNLQPDLEINCIVAFNIRTRLQPPISPEYFRCFITVAKGASKVCDLLGDGLGQAALIINQSIKTTDEKGIRTMIEQLEEHPQVPQPGPRSIYYKPYSVIIGGLSKFNMYEPEFGLGKAVVVLAGYNVEVDGKVTASPGREGDGSVDLEVYLKPENMNALEQDEEFMTFASSLQFSLVLS